MENNKTISLYNIILFLLASFLGVFSIVAPPYLIPYGIQTIPNVERFQIIATAEANFAFLPSITLLFLSGVILGLLRPQLWIPLALCTMSFFPIRMLDAVGTHNLAPFELIIMLIFTIPSLIGAYIGFRIRNRKGEISAWAYNITLYAINS